MRKIVLFGLLLQFCMAINAQGTGYVYIDGVLYHILSEEEKTAECYSVELGIQNMVIRPEVSIDGHDYIVTEIDDEAVQVLNGEHITTLTFPNTLKRIGAGNFIGNPLTELQLPPSLEYIGNESFLGLRIQSLLIPASLTHIGSEVFSGNTFCTSIMVDEKNPIYDSRDNCNAIIESATNKLVKGCQTTVVPSTVTAIAPGAFSYCNSLLNIDLPESVKSVGRSAFGGCNKLESISIHSSTPPQADEDIIRLYDYNTVVLYVPKGSKTVYQATPIWGKFTNIVEMSNTDISIGSLIKSPATIVYDLQGRRINGKPSKGVYIESGRKVVTK